MKKIVILGSTGSVGRNAVAVASYHKSEFEIVGFAVNNNVQLLRQQLELFPDALFSIGNEEAYSAYVQSKDAKLKQCLGSGENVLRRLIAETRPDLVVNCIVGFVGLKPTLAALEMGIPVAVANKEAIVSGGEILLEVSRRSGAQIIPIDSEHVAIRHCIHGHSVDEIKKIYITASGGALRTKARDGMADVDVEEVLSHPTWKMGDKITVDSATMVNKGLEVIEAHWLFSLPYEKIDIVIHPQSVVHSLVEFQNGSIVAQMGIPDMRLPILHALSYPKMISTDLAPSEITKFPSLSFAAVDMEKYPCLGLALNAARKGGNMPAVLNSANEEAVLLFLKEKIAFSGIFDIIKFALDEVPFKSIKSSDDIFETDRITRDLVRNRFCSS